MNNLVGPDENWNLYLASGECHLDRLLLGDVSMRDQMFESYDFEITIELFREYRSVVTEQQYTTQVGLYSAPLVKIGHTTYFRRDVWLYQNVGQRRPHNVQENISKALDHKLNNYLGIRWGAALIELPKTELPEARLIKLSWWQRAFSKLWRSR